MASQKKKNLPAKKGTQKKSKVSKKAKKIIVAVTVAVMALLILGGTLLVALRNGSERYKLLAYGEKTVATCNGFNIPYEELYFVTELYKDSLKYAYGEGIWDNPATAEQYREELETLVMENLNQNYLILSACKALSIDIKSKTKDNYIDSEIKRLLKKDFGGDKKAFREWLDQQHMTERYFKFCLGVEFLQSSIFYTLLDMGFYHYNTDNIDEYMDYVAESENYARTIHVYVQNDEGEDIEANRQKAKEMYDYLMAEPDAEAKEALMRDYIGSTNNEDLMISQYGYYFTYGEMEEAYEKATFALSVGEVSEVLETSDGFYIIMRLQPDMQYIMLNAQTLLSYYQSAAMGAYIETYRETCTVELTEFGQGLDLTRLTSLIPAKDQEASTKAQTSAE